MKSFHIALSVALFLCCSQLCSAELGAPALDTLAPTLDTLRMVTVTGGPGSNPVRIQWTADLTLMAAITASGLFVRESLPEVITIRHALRKGGRAIAHPKAIIKGTEADPKLLPNDTIEVSQ